MKKWILVLALALGIVSNTWADKYYWFVYSLASTSASGKPVVILSDFVQLEDDDWEQGMENQFHDWLGAYAKRLSGLEDYKFKTGSMGPYLTWAEAKQKKLETITNYSRSNYKIYDLSEAQAVPGFVYEPEK